MDPASSGGMTAIALMALAEMTKYPKCKKIDRYLAKITGLCIRRGARGYWKADRAPRLERDPEKWKTVFEKISAHQTAPAPGILLGVGPPPLRWRCGHGMASRTGVDADLIFDFRRPCLVLLKKTLCVLRP